MDGAAVCLGALIIALSAVLLGFVVVHARASEAYPAGVWCEATVVEAATSREWPLDVYCAPDPGRALQWLRAQAPRLADRADPCPDSSWAGAVPGTLRPHPMGGLRDAPTLLRRWSHDAAAYERALRTIEEGSLYLVTARDEEGLDYRLSARPLR